MERKESFLVYDCQSHFVVNKTLVQSSLIHNVQIGSDRIHLLREKKLFKKIVFCVIVTGYCKMLLLFKEN